MSTYTDYFSLKKPSRGENCLIADFNGNIDSVDLIMHQNRQMSADVYDPQRQDPYMKGECAIYENVLYECLEDNVTGTWDATKWEVTTLAKQVFKSLLNVVANPAGSASSTLTKLGIGGVNYEIQGGGGGGGGGDYTEETLWSGTQESSDGGVTINLDGNISDYDAIVIDCGRNDGNNYRHGYLWYLVSDISIGMWFLQIVNDNDNTTCYWQYTSDTSITWQSAYAAYPVTLFSIKGLKFGVGSIYHTYSTTEQVVGEWIDGSTVYEKTIDLGADTEINTSGYDITTFMPSDINHCISCEGQCDTYHSGIPLLIDYTPSNQTRHIYSGILTVVRHLTIRYTKSTV